MLKAAWKNVLTHSVGQDWGPEGDQFDRIQVRREFPATCLNEEEHEKQMRGEDVDLLVAWIMETLPYKAHRWVSEWLQVGKMGPGSPLESALRCSGSLVRTLEDLGTWDRDEAPLVVPSLQLTSATQALSDLHSRELPTTEPSSAWNLILHPPSVTPSYPLGCAESLRHVWLFLTPWTVAFQASLHMETLQAGMLEWVVVSSSRGSSQPSNWTQVSHTAGGFFTIWAIREAQEYWSGKPFPSPGDLPDPGIEPGSPALQVDSLPHERPKKPQLPFQSAHKGYFFRVLFPKLLPQNEFHFSNLSHPSAFLHGACILSLCLDVLFCKMGVVISVTTSESHDNPI